jgi:hypothetical protein
MNEDELIKLKNDVSKIFIIKNDHHFHDVISYMAELLGFKRGKNWYTGEFKGDLFKCYNYRTDIEVIANEYPDVPLSWKRELVRGGEWLKTETYYPGAEHFNNSHFTGWSLKSNSNLGLDRNICDIISLEELDFKKDPGALAKAIFSYKLVRHDNLYILSPETLFMLVERKNGIS